jgi:hypothetical protein
MAKWRRTILRELQDDVDAKRAALAEAMELGNVGAAELWGEGLANAILALMDAADGKPTRTKPKPTKETQCG